MDCKKKIIMRCRDVADILADDNVCDLSKRTCFWLKFHVFLCPFCNIFHRDIMKMQKAARAFCDCESPCETKMPDESKERLRESVEIARKEVVAALEKAKQEQEQEKNEAGDEQEKE